MTDDAERPAASGATAQDGWDCHVHVFDAAVPVRPGHYVPGHRPLAEIEATARRHGIGHLVLVQPSVYGTDNAVMHAALQLAGGRHRGVAVVDADVADAELDRLHAAGVRGVRFNRVSPAGPGGDPDAALRRLAPRLRERGWHVQWYVTARELPRVVAWQTTTGLRFVIDHLAGLGVEWAEDGPAWAAAQALADAGAWIKRSGWYRLGAMAPYAELEPSIRRIAAMFGPRLIWGSDWPHTSFAAGLAPAYDTTLAPLRAALGPSTLRAVLHGNPRALYCP